MTQFFSNWERFAPKRLPRLLSSRQSTSRCGALDFVRGKQPEFVDLSDSADLCDYLDRINAETPCYNRLFLLEDLNESSLELLGSALHIDPVVLADQLFAYHFSQNDMVPHRTLPSLTDASKSFTLRYYELRETDDRLAENQTRRRRTFARASCQIERWRDLATRRVGLRDTHVDIIRHNVSFWCGEGLPGEDKPTPGAWNAAILLVDPSLASQPAARKSYYYVLDKEEYNAPRRPQIQWSKPYHAGYSDLRPWESNRTVSAPSRQSMFDDVIFYWLRADGREIDAVFDSCVNTTLFVHQIVACHWYKLLDLQFKPLSTVDITSKTKRRGSPEKSVSTAEWREELKYYNERLSLLGILQRRLMWYKQEMILNLERLGFAPHGAGDDTSIVTPSSLRIAGQDLQATLYELDRCESRVDNLVGVVTDSINLSSALRSLHDARFGLQLSIFGAVFFPITLVAAIFSMGGDYSPGSKHFWVPWVIPVPLVTILILMIWQAHHSRL
ncbi:hypothetical protein N7448_005668 [Penicillium atrosanguineum]|uniref:uncharacterized protein n=1 Tax=Penicillium atrosanguineum TaxID=1132637 RepID=UPI00239F8F89|nr:uncharacterized protein N7443_009407 [Penicillium atrosanguineum]KAJ5126363.1 hypothetical protein N7526_008540 [Penicillium atrosanguineum]KAJ5137114.1 hypothetical protein N7448_005668 [Penicillium atrosanguineum]KAJ5293454.1 hypothetical protein N7443_009407 [Penicillium atrosanguineum]